LTLEARAEGREPIGFEVSFGGGPTEGEPLAQTDPVTIELDPGLRFRLRGRIDRIDRLTKGGYEIVDYKTGWYSPRNFDGTYLGGRLLQHALYGLAGAQLLARREPNARVAASSYYLPTVRGQGERVSYPPVDRNGLAGVLRDLFDVLAAGAFVHTQDENDCRYCEHGAACGRAPFERGQRTIAHATNAMLAPYRSLGAHE
jgi:ATP-dependent helicase/nuclease subunit B